MREYAYVYILANGFKKLYIGITTNLDKRVAEHKQAIHPDSHTARYHIDQLVYFERFTSIGAAIQREKQLKGWLRIRKLELIVATNPDWKAGALSGVSRFSSRNRLKRKTQPEEHEVVVACSTPSS